MAKAAVMADQSFEKAVAVTLSDSTTYSPPPDAFMVGVSGDVTLIDMGGNTTLIKNCVQGTIYRIRATAFKTTGTGATNLVALYFG